MTDTRSLTEILTFWFGADLADPPFREVWFKADAAFDAALQARFAGLYRQAASGAFDAVDTPYDCLAVVLLLDQVPRNLFRGAAQAFATDDKALATAVYAIRQGFDTRLPKFMRLFLYMPYQHAENRTVQQESLRLFASMGDDDIYRYAKDHYDVIDRFGRFPHRNDAMGRTSTPGEDAFLAADAQALDWATAP